MTALRSEVLFQALENGVPDVIVEPPESAPYRPVRYFDSLIKDFSGASRLSGV